MNFPSIDIQGSILSADLLGKIRSEQATFQQGKDFSTDFTNAKLKDKAQKLENNKFRSRKPANKREINEKV